MDLAAIAKPGGACLRVPGTVPGQGRLSEAGQVEGVAAGSRPPAADPPRLTASYLDRMGACMAQISRFRAEWPDGAEITLGNILRAYEIGLNVDWLVRNCLSTEAIRSLQKSVAYASRAYSEAVATADRAYEQAVAPARRVYDEARAAALAAAIVSELLPDRAPRKGGK